MSQNKPTNPQGRTPNTDMQAEDAGTADSGASQEREDPTKAMKQTSKTRSEVGSGTGKSSEGSERSASKSRENR
jgi:hypothetical protein